MNYRIHVSAQVAAEILSTASYYDGILEGLGLELEKEIDSLLQSISQNPNLYPKEFGPVYRAFVTRFKLFIYYVVNDKDAAILELRDARRLPPDWRARGFSTN